VVREERGRCVHFLRRQAEREALRWPSMAHDGRTDQRRGNVSAQEGQLGLLYSGRRRLGAQDNHSGRGTNAAWGHDVRCVRRRVVGRAAWSARRRLCARGAWRPGRGPGWRFARAAHGAWTSGPKPASACVFSETAARVGARRAVSRTWARSAPFKFRLALFEWPFPQIFKPKWASS
jgi:hypothetical protein